MTANQNIYGQYAHVYDDSKQIGFSLRMIPYLNEILARHPIEVRSALDLACGTGTVALAFAAKGWETYGVDGSADMLQEARRKMATSGVAVAFSQQDMRSFRLPHPVDLATCFYDSLNYLLGIEDLRRAFGRVCRALRPGGMFIFDMNTPWVMEHGWKEGTYFVEGDQSSVIMQTAFLPETGRAVATITGFVRRGDLYERFVEEHVEQGYTVEEISDALHSAGLSVVAMYDCFAFNPPSAESRRILWVAQRPI